MALSTRCRYFEIGSRTSRVQMGVSFLGIYILCYCWLWCLVFDKAIRWCCTVRMRERWCCIERWCCKVRMREVQGIRSSVNASRPTDRFWINSQQGHRGMVCALYICIVPACKREIEPMHLNLVFTHSLTWYGSISRSNPLRQINFSRMWCGVVFISHGMTRWFTGCDCTLGRTGPGFYMVGWTVLGQGDHTLGPS